MPALAAVRTAPRALLVPVSERLFCNCDARHILNSRKVGKCEIMAIPIRRANRGSIAADSRTFFITSSIAGKRNLLQSDRSARLFIEVLYHYRSEHKYFLHNFVVMRDHFHVLSTVGPAISIERAVQLIKGGFAFRAGKELGFRSPVWQRGFSEVRIYDSEHMSRVREYIAQNP